MVLSLCIVVCDDGDGRRDIWKNKADVFASIANYIHKNGWKVREPWGTEVKIPARLAMHDLGLKDWRTVGQWRRLGVVRKKGELRFPDSKTRAALITMDDGTSFLVYKNFKVIMTYNRSNYYAASVGYLADRICRRR